MPMDKDAGIYVAGGDTLIGSALLRKLDELGYKRVLGTPEHAPDLTHQGQVTAFFGTYKPDYVFVASGKSGGIAANQKYPADLAYDNLLSSTLVMGAAHKFKVKRLLYLASSCCYPKLSPQPMKIEHLGSGPLEPTNEAYASAKLAGLQLCLAYRKQFGADFIAGIPANAFGIGDHLEPEDAHVIPALLVRMEDARAKGLMSIDIWGTGKPRREFIFADDLADACIFVMNRYTGSGPLNLGGGQDVTIREVAEMIREVVAYPGALKFDASKPDGMPLKALDSSALLELGWKPATSLRDALVKTYQWIREARTGTETSNV